MSASIPDAMNSGDGESLSQLRQLARDYEAGTIGRAAYRQNRRQLIQTVTEAPIDNSLDTTVSLNPGSDPFGRAAPGMQPQAADLTQALSARPLTQFAPRPLDGSQQNAGTLASGGVKTDSRPAKAHSHRKGFSGALLAAIGLVMGAAVLGILLSSLLGG